MPFKPILRRYEAMQIAGKWRIFNMLTRKTAKDLEFDRQDDAIRALNDLKTMMRSIRGLVAYYTPEETELVKQQGRVAYENQMKRNMLRKKKPKPSKFNEKPEKYFIYSLST